MIASALMHNVLPEGNILGRRANLGRRHQVSESYYGTFKDRGFTLIELMVVIAIAAILAAIAVPGFNDFFVKNRVKGATEEIFGLILMAKREGTIRDTNLTLSFNEDADPWCVGLSDAPCNCTDTTSCVLDVAGVDGGVTQIVNGTNFDNVTIDQNFAGNSTTFSRIRGNAGGGTVQVASGNWGLNIVVSTLGRIRVCNPNNNVMTGYEQCN